MSKYAYEIWEKLKENSKLSFSVILQKKNIFNLVGKYDI